MKVTGVDISPDPVKSGHPATFKIYATSGNTLILSSYLSSFVVFKNSIKFYFICMYIAYISALFLNFKYV